uniref:Thioredoxin domain-containing protein n=1 Tax=Oncorhynchus tshawytscha TaxID=74940 RepID=A0AAZ3R1J5_ONCTS
MSCCSSSETDCLPVSCPAARRQRLTVCLSHVLLRAKNVVASARPPVRFFSAEAPVVDLYLGQLEQVERLRGAAEVSVIFFYAPWCAHSIAARHEVQEVARRLVKQVQFVAVNCWWSQGKCRKQKSFYQYPVIHLFYKRFGPIEYKGPFLASYVERFILRVITPLTYLPSRATLQDFLSYHEPGVVGYFQFNSSPQPPGYITYLSSALQALKRDFRGAVRFGVVTSRQVAESISVRDDQTVYLHRHFNSSLIFPSWERNFTSEGICSWVFEHRETVLQWLAPTGAKSRLLEQELTKGPALLLFLPHNPLGPGPDPLLTQVSRYSACCRTLGQLGVSLPPQQGLGLDNEGLGIPRPSPSSSQDDSSPSSQDSSPSSQDQDAGGIKGLRCRTNKTLRFYILDSALHWPLAVRLGALGNGTGDGAQSFATIVNLKDEVHYVLDHRGTLFIRNFSTSHSPLQRRLVGRRGGGGGGEAPEETPHLRDVVLFYYSQWCGYKTCCVLQDVVLFYYSQWCGYCSVLNHVIIQLARMFRGNSTVTIARVNVARNDLPWEFMVDHFPSVLLFPRHRKHLSVKFPEDTPITLPTLLRFILKHSDSAHQPMKADGSDPHPHVLLKAEFRALQGEVQTLHRARQRLSNQLAQLWRDNRRLSFDAVALETHNALLHSQNGELQRERLSLVEQHKEKSRQLGEAVRRLQELADASENLLTENTLLRVLLGALRARETERGEEENEEEETGEEEDETGEEETGEERSYMAS